MRRKNKQAKLVALIFALCLIGLGYAYLTTNLKIKGTTNISNNRWDVHFENAKVEDKSDTVSFESNSNSNLAQGIPVIKGDNNTELEWQVVLNQPGDYYVVSSDIVNAGDMDAKIDLENSFFTYQFDNNDEQKIALSSSYLDFEPFIVKFNDNTPYLNAGESNNIIVGILLSNNISNETWENIKSKTIKMKLELKYKQSNNPKLYNISPRIRFENPVVDGYSDTISFPTNNSIPSITNLGKAYGFPDRYSNVYTEHTIEQSLIFNQPGDYYEFSMDVINEWFYYAKSNDENFTITIDNGPEIDIGYEGEVPEYFNYHISTDDELDSYGFTFLEKNKSEKVSVRIELKNDLTPEQLAEIQGKTVKLKYYMKYNEYISPK